MYSSVPPQPRVLVAGADRERPAITEALGRAYALTFCEERAQLEAHLDAGRFEVVIASERVGDACGLELLSWVSERRPDAGRILLSDTADLRTAVRARTAAYVSAVLPSPVDMAHLVEEIENATAQYSAVRSLRMQADRLSSTTRSLGERLRVTPRSR